jgi:hypothetical protein
MFMFRVPFASGSSLVRVSLFSACDSTFVSSYAYTTLGSALDGASLAPTPFRQRTRCHVCCGGVGMSKQVTVKLGLNEATAVSAGKEDYC